MADALWLYGVLDGDARVPDGPGVEGGVEAVRHAGLAALVSRVGLERFGEAALREALEDLETLERLARAHERVLDEALRSGPVLPFRICTLFESQARVRELLERERPSLTAALARLRGKAEWGVKAFAPAHAPEAAPATSGAAYLARKRAARTAGEQLDAALATVHERLGATAEGAVLSPGQDRRMVLNASYLVANDDVPAFTSLVAELSSVYGVALELTGPWPAYHFSR